MFIAIFLTYAKMEFDQYHDLSLLDRIC